MKNNLGAQKGALKGFAFIFVLLSGGCIAFRVRPSHHGKGKSRFWATFFVSGI